MPEKQIGDLVHIVKQPDNQHVQLVDTRVFLKVITVIKNGPIVASKTGKMKGLIYFFDMFDDNPSLNKQFLPGCPINVHPQKCKMIISASSVIELVLKHGKNCICEWLEGQGC